MQHRAFKECISQIVYLSNAAARAASESFGFSGYALSAQTGNAILLQKAFRP